MRRWARASDGTRAMVVATALVAACNHGGHEDRTPGPARVVESNDGRATSAPTASRPNVVLVLADDLDAGLVAFMPRLKDLVVAEGTSFPAFFVTDSLCCPSRASILRGQYVHNHGIAGNAPPLGGFEKFRALGCEQSTIAVWLRQAGYRTAMIGKYLNGYPEGVSEAYVPPGWDEWASPVDQSAAYRGFSYRLNENGRLVSYDRAPADYLTDVLAEKASAFIGDAARRSVPFFLYLAPYAPHAPATPAPRDKRLFAGVRLPRSPSFGEADVSDKPGYVRGLPPVKPPRVRELGARYRGRLRSVQAVDAMIERLIATLRSTGQLDRTWIFFTSDNGFHLGEHRLPAGKQSPYDEDIRVPLAVRGPGVPAGRTAGHLAIEIDLAPTFAEIGGVAPPELVDGRSLVPLLARALPPVDTWRQGVLVEHDAGSDEPFEPAVERGGRPRAPEVPTYRAVRTAEWLYVEYATGERELYDLRRDPHELENLYARADADLLRCLAAQLDALRGCAGPGCRSAEARRCPRPR